MSNEQIEAVELSIEQAKDSVATMETLNKLISNDLFKKIITEGYFEKEASRLVLIKAEPSMQGEVEQKTIEDGITAIGHLRQYFVKIKQMGAMAQRAMDDDEQTLEELRNEDL